jgi:peptidoglycan LD-endopeptidase LytH
LGPSRRTFLPLALLTVVALWLPTPGAASTRDQLDSAKQRLTSLQAEIQQVTAAYQAAYDRYARTVDRIQATARDIQATQARIARVRHALSMRARSAYEVGAGGALNVLLSSGTLSEFSDRLEFLGAVERSDHDLVTVAEVQTARLRRDQQDLASLARQQRSLASSLRSQEAALTSRFHEEQALVDQLTQKLKAEQKTKAENRILGVRTVSGGVLATCPVAGPHSYVDSFGAPRSGGRTHQGDDIMAPRGTPVVAAQAGNAVQDPNSLGGNSVIVYATNGDYTYYAHLDSYGASGQVSAGTQIGTVGNTGDAAGGPTHLHFEYHPGGGAAVDPTSYLDAVC